MNESEDMMTSIRRWMAEVSRIAYGRDAMREFRCHPSVLEELKAGIGQEYPIPPGCAPEMYGVPITLREDYRPGEWRILNGFGETVRESMAPPGER